MAQNRGRRAALRRLGAGALASLAPYATLAGGAGGAETRYRGIAPQPVPAGPVIEIVEFFWYGCPYCHALQPPFESWMRRQPADVVLRRVPAVFRPSWVPHARLFFTLDALGSVDALHQQVYRSYHVDGTPLDSADAIASWAAAQGLDRQHWLEVYESPDVDGRVLQARDQLARYTVSGTPSVVVDGRYLTSSGMTPGVAAMIPVLDHLVARTRDERGLR